MPSHPYFDKSRYGHLGQGSLSRLLKAYSVLNPDVGYAQGMNYIAGFLLILSDGDEDKAFQVFYKLFED